MARSVALYGSHSGATLYQKDRRQLLVDAPTTEGHSAMTYEIVYRRDGVDFETDIRPGPEDAAIAVAGKGLVARKAQSARVRDLAGSTAEICSLLRDGKGGYVRDER